MSEQSTQVLTQENAAFVAVQKVATADIVATKHHPGQPEGAVLQEGVDIYIVVQPEGPNISQGNEYWQYPEKLRAYGPLMRKRAGIPENAQLWYADIIVPASIQSIFDRIESTNRHAQNRNFVNGALNDKITVVTKRHA